MRELKGGNQDLFRCSFTMLLPAVAYLAITLCPAARGQAPHIGAFERAKIAAKDVETSPRDVKKRFELAESLRLSGDLKKAAVEYLDVTSLEPAYYIAYHQLIRTKPSSDQLDEALERLKKLEEHKPKNLMLRVALSEVLEQKGDLYDAARTLVDLQYAHGIPEKYQAKINARIHYLLSKTRDVANLKTAQQHVQETDTDIDAVPVPLPDSGLDRGLSATKLKDSKVPAGYGHARLLP